MSRQTTHRDYRTIAAGISRAVPGGADLTQRMQLVVDALWEHLHETGVSWVGFYLKDPDRDEMILGPRRDQPACSPIGLHGACGQAWTENRPLVIADVRTLGSQYIACDPRDLSEVVLPIRDGQGHPFAVLDLDSHALASFTEADVSGLSDVLRAAGLMETGPGPSAAG